MRTKSIRRLDGQGRVILPAHIRKQLNLSPDSAVTIDMTDDGRIVIAPAEDRCCVCGRSVHGLPFTQALTVGTQEKLVCAYCFASMRDKDWGSEDATC